MNKKLNELKISLAKKLSLTKIKTGVKLRGLFSKTGYSNKPDFLIIGAQKCGTSGLFEILSQHSFITPSVKKEINYFNQDKWYNEGKIYQYHSFFPLPFQVKRGAKFFEATPAYLFHPDVPARLHSYNPNLKLIILLREPAARAFSAWTMYHHHFKKGKNRHLYDSRPFSKAINEEIEVIESESFHENPIAYVKRGIYHEQIERFLKYFNKEQLLILESKDLKENFDITIKNIQDFIEVPYEELGFVRANTRKKDEKSEYGETIESLKEFYKPFNKNLFKLLGKEFNW